MSRQKQNAEFAENFGKAHLEMAKIVLSKKCGSCGKMFPQVPTNAKPMLDEGKILGFDWQCECGSNVFMKADRVTPRLVKFYDHAQHPMFHKLLERLTKEEFALCVQFIQDNSGLNNDDFNLKVNRWFLDVPNKPKRLSDMWALVLQSVIK